MPSAERTALSTSRLTRVIPSHHVRVPAHVLDRGRGHADVHAARWDGPAAGGPVQVCVHGLGGSCLNWALLGPRLSDRGTVWAPDLAGFGRTLPSTRSASVEDNLDLLAGFVATIADGRPVVLYGNSMGGHLAYTLAARRPDLVAGLVLVGPAVPPLTRRPDPQVALRFALLATPFVGRAWLEQLASRLTPAEQVRGTMELCMADPDSIDPEVFEAHTELVALRRLMPHVYPAYLDAARTLLRRIGPGRRRVWEDIDAVRAPTLVLQGALDRLITLESVERVLARRPDWDHRIYSDLGHIVMLEDPQRVVDDVFAWRDRVGLDA